MTRAFVDTDVLIRLLTGDDPTKQQAAAQLFSQVEQGEVQLVAPVTAIADAVYVLTSPRLYHLPRPEVRELLSVIIRLPQFALDQKSAVLRALEIFGLRSIDFGDCLIVASMEARGLSTLYSFDHDFDAFDAIQRQEPAA